MKASIGERKHLKCSRIARDYLDAYLAAHRKGGSRTVGYRRMRKLRTQYRKHDCGDEIETLFNRVYE